MVRAWLGWTIPAATTVFMAAVFAIRGPGAPVLKAVMMGCAGAALAAYLSTVSLKLSWNTRFFWMVWAVGLLIRWILAGVVAWVVLKHTHLHFVATMASLIGFTAVFSMVEAVTCLKKG